MNNTEKRNLSYELANCGIELLCIPYGDMQLKDYYDQSKEIITGKKSFKVDYNVLTDEGFDKMLSTINNLRFKETYSYTKTILEIETEYKFSLVTLERWN